MTTTIGRDHHEHAADALSTSESDTGRISVILTCVKIFTGTAGAGWVATMMLAFVNGGWREALAAATLSIFAVVGGAVLCVHAVIASRLEFYKRGHLDGWMRGWRGQEPQGEDPLFR